MFLKLLCQSKTNTSTSKYKICGSGPLLIRSFRFFENRYNNYLLIIKMIDTNI